MRDKADKMKDKIDVISERADRGLCPVCEKPIGADFKVEEYNGKKVWICKEHPTAEIKT